MILTSFMIQSAKENVPGQNDPVCTQRANETAFYILSSSPNQFYTSSRHTRCSLKTTCKHKSPYSRYIKILNRAMTLIIQW